MNRRDLLKGAAALGASAFLPGTARAALVGGGSIRYLEPCGSAGTVPGARCWLYRVDVPGLPGIRLKLRVSYPAIPAIGWVLLMSGGLGGDFYADQAGGDILTHDLVNRGFAVIDRQWGGGGWINGPQGLKLQANRGAVLMKALRASADRQGLALIAVGNSGGAGELGYGVVHYNAVPHRAIYCGGPPFSRLQHLCASPPSKEWIERCLYLGGHSSLGCLAVPFSAPKSIVCPYLLPPAQQAADSICSVPGSLSPAEHRVLLGTADCTVAVYQALEFADVYGLTGNWVTSAGHFMAGTAAGRAAIMAEVTAP